MEETVLKIVSRRVCPIDGEKCEGCQEWLVYDCRTEKFLCTMPRSLRREYKEALLEKETNAT